MPAAISHPALDALALLMPSCDGAFAIDSVGFNKYDAEHYRLRGMPVTDAECDREAARLVKYHKQLPAYILAALRGRASVFRAEQSGGEHNIPLIIRGPGQYFIVRNVTPHNKDSIKAAAERITGKRVMLWNIPEAAGSWVVNRKFVGALIRSGEFDHAEDVTEDSYEVFAPPMPTAPCPAVEWAALQPMRNLYHFQKTGVEFIVPALAEPGKGVILADEPGLGKTAQAITTAMCYGEKVVVVCPAGIKYNWANEIFLIHPTWTVHVLGDRTPSWKLMPVFGRNAARLCLLPQMADVIIMSYEATRRLVCGNSDPVTSRYNTMKMVVRPEVATLFADRVIVMDEAHYMKNVSAKRAQSGLAVCRGSRRVICMTGTPICNRPQELWTLLCATGRNNEVAGSAADFKASYVEGNRLQVLHQRLMDGKFFIRRLKKDVLTELPPKQRQDMVVEMSPRQQLEYENLRLSLKSNVAHGGMAKNGTCILALLTALQTKANEAKVEPIVEDLYERFQAGAFTVVQSTRLEPLKRVQEACSVLGMHVALLCGGSSDADRKMVCHDFAEGKIHAVLTTLAEGINLQKADKVVLLDLDWSPAKISQREDRIHRIGQTEHVTVMRVLAASIDHHKKNVVATKQEVIDIAIDGGDSAHSDDALMAEVIRRLTDDV